MSTHPINEMIGTTMSKIREMVDVNTIIGEPINTPSGTTIIPVSRITMGFGSGGSDFATKNQPSDRDNAFGGGGGAGVNITPVGFLVINGSQVRMLPVDEPASTSLERAIEKLPELIDKVTALIEQKKAEKAESNQDFVLED